MSDTFDYALEEFSRRYDAMQDAQGKALLCIMATGGAMGLSQLGVVPGASKRLAGTYHPYSMHELYWFVKPALLKLGVPDPGENDWRSVHADSAIYYLEALKTHHPEDRFFVASTAALETTRQRRGENCSYIAMQRTTSGPFTLWKVHFRKYEDVHWSIDHYPNKPSKMLAPKEVWERAFLEADGSPNLSMLGSVRRSEDQKLCLIIMGLILDDKDFAMRGLSEGDSITQLAFNADAMEYVWAERPVSHPAPDIDAINAERASQAAKEGA